MNQTQHTIEYGESSSFTEIVYIFPQTHQIHEDQGTMARFLFNVRCQNRTLIPAALAGNGQKHTPCVLDLCKDSLMEISLK